MATKDEVLEAISSMTLLEVVDLTKALEVKFGVVAATQQVIAPKAPELVVEEKTEFTVILKAYDEAKKIPAIKEVRAITGLGLKEAKELVEAGNKVIRENISKEEAAKIKTQLEAVGATVEIQ
jgi:large subunit ribosomal protein L7/L12